MKDLQARLGHQFSNIELLNLALTHRSYGEQNNERMEFLGDSVLNFVTADFLFTKFPRLDEGSMSRLRARLVSEKALAKLAVRLDIDRYVKRAVVVKGNGVDTMLADAVEALFAAVYKDAGFDATKKVIVAHLDETIRLNEVNFSKDAKTKLQELLQAKGYNLPFYTVTKQGQTDADRYEVACAVPALQISHKGVGSTRKAAEQAAAELVVSDLGRAVR